MLGMPNLPKMGSKFTEGHLFQIEFASGSNIIVKSEAGFFWCHSWCKIHEKMEWLKAIEPLNMDEVITILEISDTLEEYEKFFIEKNRTKKVGL